MGKLKESENSNGTCRVTLSHLEMDSGAETSGFDEILYKIVLIP